MTWCTKEAGHQHLWCWPKFFYSACYVHPNWEGPGVFVPGVMHICISKLGHRWFRKWLVAWLASSHYLNQCWNIFIQEYPFEHLFWKMVVILPQPPWLKLSELNLSSDWLIITSQVIASKILEDLDYELKAFVNGFPELSTLENMYCQISNIRVKTHLSRQ